MLLTRLKIEIDDTRIVSKILPKEKGEEKYTDAILFGYLSFFTTTNTYYIVSLGNIDAEKHITMTTEYIELHTSEDE